VDLHNDMGTSVEQDDLESGLAMALSPCFRLLQLARRSRGCHWRQRRHRVSVRRRAPNKNRDFILGLCHILREYRGVEIDLWVCNIFAGILVSKKDINVLKHSPLFSCVVRGEWPPRHLSFQIKGRTCLFLYYLFDGIYTYCRATKGGLPPVEGSNGRLSPSRDTRYGTRGSGSQAGRNAKTNRHVLPAGDEGASHRRRPSS